MIESAHIETILKNNISEPAFIIDSRNNVVNLNAAGKKLLPGVVAEDNLFSQFDIETSSLLNEIITEANSSAKVIKKEITVYSSKNDIFSENYEISVSPLKDTEFVLFFITFKKIKISVNIDPDKSRFKILYTGIEDLLKANNLSKIFNTVKSSYPFSLIEKSQFQKEIDNLEQQFWIKDQDGRYQAVNKKFADSIGLKVEQTIGRFEKDVIPRYLVRFNESINNYIKDTTNTVIFDGVYKTEENSDNPNEIVQFPITDIDNAVVAIVGFTITKKEDIAKATASDLVIANTFKIESESKIILDSSFKIIACSDGFRSLFDIDKEIPVENSSVIEILGQDFVRKIKHIDFDTNKSSSQFIHNFYIEDDQQTIDVCVERIITSKLDTQYLVKFNLPVTNDSETSAKGKMFDIIMKSSPEAIFVYEIENLKFLEVNEAALELYGYTRDEFLQMDLTDLYAPEDIQTLLESATEKVIENKFIGPWRHKHRNGKTIVVELSKTTTEYEGKKAHINLVRDVTEKLSTEKQLKLFKTTFEYSSDLIFITDTDGFITFSNDAVDKKLGLSFDDLDGRPFLSLLSDADRAKINMNVFHSDDQSEQDLEIQIKDSSNELLNSIVHASPIRDYNNEVDSFVLVVSLKTQPIGIDDIRIPENSEMEGGLQASFLSNLFHELLTPMNVIVGFVQELTESLENPTDEQKESMEIIRENQKILLQTMDTAVEYSQVEQSNFELKSEEIVFVELLDGFEDNSKRLAENRGMELNYSKISSSLSFYSDKQKFVTLVNLVIKFAMSMTSNKRIYLSAYSNDSDEFYLGIKDHKAGISDELLKNLRDTFTIDETTIRHNFGISRFTVRLARRLKDILSEKIEIVKKADKAFEFAFVFPHKLEPKSKSKEDIAEETQEIRVPDVIDNLGFVSEPKPKEPLVAKGLDDVKPEPIIIEEDPRKSERGIDFTELSCLYVEDQVDSQILFKVQTKELKSIDFSASFEEALPLLKTKSFNFIVMDINLQGEYNGLDALRIIRKMPAYQDIPIIAVSAYVLPGDREKFIAAGFNDFITKPVLQDKLYDSLEKVFKG